MSNSHLVCLVSFAHDTHTNEGGNWLRLCRFGRQQQQQRPPRTVEVPLKLTLKELYAGTRKKLKVTRRVYNKETNKLEEKEVCQCAPDPGIWRLSLSFLS